MRQAHRMPTDRARITGGALLGLLACVALFVVALAAWRRHERAATADPPGVSSLPAAARPATAQPPIRLAIPAQPPADVPWAGTSHPPGIMAYQCASSAGENFQTEPCPEGALTEWSREATREDLALIADHEAAMLQARHVAEVAHFTQLYGDAAAPAGPRAATAGEQRGANCASARQYRDAQLAQSGLNRNFDQIRRLDDIVYEACNSR